MFASLILIKRSSFLAQELISENLMKVLELSSEVFKHVPNIPPQHTTSDIEGRERDICVRNSYKTWLVSSKFKHVFASY